jgi:hypothetical protein
MGTMRKAFLLLIGACGILATMGACSSTYYKVRDPASDKVYYTDDYENLRGGSVRFKDIVTQQTITLSSSQVLDITEAEFKANVHGQ